MCFRTESLDSSLVLNEPGSSSTSPSRFPRMLVENQALRPIMRALKPGAQNCLDESLAGFEIFTADRSIVGTRQLVHHRNIHGQIGSAIRERNALDQRSVCVDHGRRNGLVVVNQCFFKRLYRLMRCAGLGECFGGAAPNSDQTGGSGALFEFMDIGTDLLGQVHLVLALFDVGSSNLL